MNRSVFRLSAATAAITLLAVAQAPPARVAAAGSTPPIIISEVHPAGSGNGTYNADWFELTNAGTSAVNISGWKMDDNSNASGSAVPLLGVTSIGPGQSVVFIDATVPVDINGFEAAWFGSNVPVGFAIGTYGGSGVGLSTSGDAVNIFDGDGNRITGVSFGTAPAAGATFDNTAATGSATLPLPGISAASVVGFNGAFRSADGKEVGSPGRRLNASPLTGVDLSTYVRVGRFDLPEPTRTSAPVNNLLAQEASGVTYDWDTDTLFIVGDGGTSVTQVSKSGQLIDTMTLARGSSPQGTEFYDTEGIAYVGHNQFVFVEERDRQVVLFTYAPGTTLTRADTRTVKLGTFVDNIGIEGITYEPSTNRFVAVKEVDPEGLFETGIDFVNGTATNGSPTTQNSINLFPLTQPFAGLADFADVFSLSNLSSLTGPESGNLLVLSQESGKILNIDTNGGVHSALTILSDPGNPLSVAGQQHEGLTMDGNGFLYTVSENGGGDFDHPQLWVYAPSQVPNQAPTALTLTNQVTSIPENSSTTTRVKVADVVIADDGLGTNDLSVIGADAASFEVDATGLYIKAGTVLDFETKNSYSVTVTVDDATIPPSPDQTASFALALTDVVENTPPGSTLVITEVAPWASGDSPGMADWFEVTNVGAAAVNVSGWKMDDNSAKFASAVPMAGVTSIAPGESVIFIETADLASAAASLRSTWFGGTAPAGLQIGSYSGSGVGLSTGGDQVNLYDASGGLQASVTFGAAPGAAPFATFDNSALVNNGTITALSVVGAHGAFTAANDSHEIGSPGSIGPLGRLIISEVAPWSSGNSPIRADWFEVTNVGGTPVDVTGWKVDDSSESFVAAVPLAGIASIAPGESVIFIETATPDATAALFRSTWFGANPAAALQVGSYSGDGIGLSTGGDAVNLYDRTGTLRAKVFFGAASSGPAFATFDNAAGLNNAAITQLAVAGQRGAFIAAGDPAEIGSPGTIGAGDDDLDDDGISDSVDPEPANPANQTFSDALAPLTGTTTGVILARNDKTLTVADAPTADAGVALVVGGSGIGPVQVRLDGKAETISLPDGSYILTDPAATSTVAVSAGGPAQIDTVLNSYSLFLTVSEGGSVSYTDTLDAAGALVGFRVDAVTGAVTLNGAAVSSPVTLVGPPQSADVCRKNGWQAFNFPRTFGSQTECVSFVQAAAKPPKVTVPEAQRVEAAGPQGTVVKFTATAVDPLDGVLPAVCTPMSGSTFPIGITTVACSAVNSRGQGDVNTFRVNVRDTMAPTIVSLTPSVAVLPDTNQTVPVSIAAVVTDIADPAPVCQIVNVTGQGKDLDHDAVIDWTVTGPLTLTIDANARKKRDRNYTITVRCTDASGNKSKDKAVIVVSHAP